ncbi:hypothetical protein KJE20_02349 [Pyrenophora tritici-repentis]|uniref:Uncharacterized protein n=2 Tax=Pyrenophora tritici-repentis TaxID=45151 RepID=A0A317A0F2_9PLEO|nr:hypothetical protein Ptr86124_003307 [Pyrenophora tritici-repentis]KAI1689171.1 hypothetical protein KJE20_02349 [Pyrenophora tritici-repentis]
MTNIAKYGMQKRKSNPSHEIRAFLTQDCAYPNSLLIHRISPRATVMESLYERFLAYFTSDGEERDVRNRKTWLYSLPVLSADGTNEALTLAIQATAYAFCAVEAADIAIKQHFLKLYGQALRNCWFSLIREHRARQQRNTTQPYERLRTIRSRTTTSAGTTNQRDNNTDNASTPASKMADNQSEISSADSAEAQNQLQNEQSEHLSDSPWAKFTAEQLMENCPYTVALKVINTALWGVPAPADANETRNNVGR